MMRVGVVGKKCAGREGGMVGRIGVEPRLQADCVVLRVRHTHSPHWCEGRLLAHPVGRVHDQRTLRRGHFHPVVHSPPPPTPPHDADASHHPPSRSRAGRRRGRCPAPTAVHLVDGRGERAQCGEVHQGVIHGVGSFIGDLVMIVGPIPYHVLSVQEEVCVHL